MAYPGVCQCAALQAKVRRDLGQDLIGTLAGKHIGLFVFLQVPGLVVRRDRDFILFVLADLYHVAVKDAGIVLFQGDDPPMVPHHIVVREQRQFQGGGGA